jgi:antitoxin CptB
MISAQEKARITWACRRGMLELDLILTSFLQKGFSLLNKEQIKSFNSLLAHTDPELYEWLMGSNEPDDMELAQLVAFVRTHS